MARTTPHRPSSWLASFYWRVGLSYVLLVLVMLVAQSVLFGFFVARANAQNRGRQPNQALARTAAALGAALEANPARPLPETLVAVRTDAPWSVHAVMKDGRVAGAETEPLPEAMRLAAQAILTGRAAPAQDSGTGPSGLITAPIVVRDELVGLIVVVPPMFPSPIRDIGRVMTLPGMLLLPVAAAVATLVIFGPARRRLAALERAAAQLGTGDLEARAPESGHDEIARVASAFNRMAAELAERDRTIREGNDRRRQMLADVSHELKTPLTTIRGSLETLQMPADVVDNERRLRSLEMIDRETSRMERIVVDLLALARHEHGVGRLDAQVFAPGLVFLHVVRRHEQAADARQVAFEVHVDEGADQVVGDPHLIEQAVDNLVVNALRYTPEGGRVRLQAGLDTDGDAAVLSVVDSGRGIAPEHLAHVFERFYKADQSRLATMAGSGLGLSIVKAIAERHGGRVDVTSAPGRTAFSLHLPQPPRLLEPGSSGPAMPAQSVSANL